MNNEFIIAVVSVLLLGVATAAGWLASARRFRAKRKEAEDSARAIIASAHREAEALKREQILSAKEDIQRRSGELNAEIVAKQTHLLNLEQQIHHREESLENKVVILNAKELELKAQESNLASKIERQRALQRELSRVLEEQNALLERVGGITREEARKTLTENMTAAAKSEAAQYIKDVRDKAQLESKKEAQRIIIQAIQRTATQNSADSTISVIHLPSEEVKGWIIGREGRNIRAFEAATGVDLIIDESPDTVVLSCFDPFRREIARVALERLIADKRVHPARIDDVVESVRTELTAQLARAGEDAMLELGLQNVHPEIVRHTGLMRFRLSYGQNLLSHSIEVAYLCGIMAAELGLDATIAKRAGLLHDIGKIIDRNTQGPHALLGFELAKRYNESAIVANAIGSHHEDIPMETPYAVLVQAADAISGARPGARRESLDGYIKRLQALETLAGSFEGVSKTYAIQAGREVRVIVEPDKLDDLAADRLSNEIAAKIQESVEYPGQIKVTVIREKRSTAYAK